MRRVWALSSTSLLLLLISSASALAQTFASIELLKGEKGSVSRSITNDCRAPHTFELTENPELEWFGVGGASRRLIAPRGKANLLFEFDSEGMDVGTYDGELFVHCLDCAEEQRCEPKRFAYTLRMRVRRQESDTELEEIGEDEFVAGQVLVALNVKSRKAAEAAAHSLELKEGLRLLSVFKLSSISRFLAHFAILDSSHSVASVVKRLEREALVDYAQHVYRYFGFASPQQDYVGRQYGLKQVRADLAQRYSNGHGVKIAVVDTGIDDEHPDLRGSVSRTKDFTKGGGAYNQDIHGTSMAGIIAAIPRNGFGIDGIAPAARIISVKVLTQTSPSGATDGSAAVVCRGIEFAINSNVDLINMSYGSSRRDPTVTRQVKAAVRRGIVVVVAAGNGGQHGRPSYPAALDEVIAVSAVDDHGAFYSGGTRGDYIDLTAPGVDIISTWPNNVYQYSEGTSSAAAHVTGVVALLLSKKPHTSPQRIKTVLEQTATHLDAGGKNVLFGSGLVDACKALNALVGGELCR